MVIHSVYKKFLTICINGRFFIYLWAISLLLLRRDHGVNFNELCFVNAHRLGL